ncbi:MAG TPA: LytTR family DNA-binding domain-containing protein [Pseudosphingobacterium sp.]|nr:LytTR family DNA-binding domain-containing protein [Pseudosphingobacterium sp.]
MRKLRVFIVDDEPPSLDLQKALISRIWWLEWVGCETDPFVASEILQTNDLKIDIVLLDVELPGLFGTEIAKVIPPEICIIFSSAYGNYALEAFSLNAVDFIHKPFSYERFCEAMEKARRWLSIRDISAANSTGQRYNVKLSGKGHSAFLLDEEVIYVETLRDNLYFHLQDVSYKTNYSIEYIMQKLNNDLFLQVHRSFVVNVKKVRGVSKGNIIMNNDKEIPIGDLYRNAFYERFGSNGNIRDL